MNARRKERKNTKIYIEARRHLFVVSAVRGTNTGYSTNTKLALALSPYHSIEIPLTRASTFIFLIVTLGGSFTQVEVKEESNGRGRYYTSSARYKREREGNKRYKHDEAGVHTLLCTHAHKREREEKDGDGEPR